MSEQISLSCSLSKNKAVMTDSIHVRVALGQSIHFVLGKDPWSGFCHMQQSGYIKEQHFFVLAFI